MNYLVHKHGQQHGPFSEAALRQKLANGEFAPMDMAWREGLPGWMPLKNVLPPEMPPLPGVPAAPVPPPLPPGQTSPQPVATLPVPTEVSLREPVASPTPHRTFSEGVSKPAWKRQRTWWPWVLGAVILCGFGLLFTIGFLVLQKVNKQVTAASSAEKPLFEDRAGHRTVWKKSSHKASGPAEDPPKEVFEKVRYPSDAGSLVAYVTPDPKDGKKHPAIVWAHGGFGGISSYFWQEASKYDDQSARAFREAGIVLMTPSWRGENDNPGRFELFFGEVNDLLAAVKHVKTLPYVDPNRVYIGGHSTGGTLTLLASTASDEFRAAFSLGGMPDGRDVLYAGEGFGNTPYDSLKERESLLRSPIRYTRFITRPTFYFEGEDNPTFAESAQKMGRRAANINVPFQAFTLPGTHFDIVHPVTSLVARKILADTGDTCNMSFTDAELRQAYDEAFSHTLGTVLTAWLTDGGDLTKALKDLDADDAEPRTTKHVKLLKQTIEKLRAAPAGPVITGQIAALTEICDSVTDSDIYDALVDEVLPAINSWAKKRLGDSATFAAASGEDPSEAAQFLQVLQYVLDYGETGKARPLVVVAARNGVGQEDYTWTSLFNTFSTDPEQMTLLVKDLKGSLPPGFAGVALLDSANQARLKDKWKGVHPFDSAAGVALLQEWLESRDTETTSYAHSAAVGLAYLSPTNRAKLLPLALAHPDEEVRLEAAWSDLKNEGTTGLDVLKKACLDVHRSSTAKRYLEELKHAADIPAAAKEPEFAAKATMSEWLQHPNELGAPPLSLEVYDKTELYWPPRQQKIPLWLFKFTYRFDSNEGEAAKEVKTSYGMVGTVTWSFFAEDAAAPTPGHLYVKHCALELEHQAEDEEDEDEDHKLDKKKWTTEEWRVEARKQLEKSNPGRSFE
ncbi:alpha/beta fold hydrolase [Verrucomicrobium spinosum]|uniref:alpha/beta fold hydrolase n=1 Tax=Verrucomicrobium spinosum TaxID=2736 RepID=UPI0018DEC318|nr:alpha/beta fold hydrolase [Verrucomicrobium spinosum]